MSLSINAMRHYGIDCLKEIDNGAFDADVLLAASLNENRAYLWAHGDRVITEAQHEAFSLMLKRRQLHEPVSRILGYREFWSLDFTITKDTLDPRPETELVVMEALKIFPSGPEVFIDAGTGTGCIGISLLSEWANARAIGTDISLHALRVAQGNALKHKVDDRFLLVQTSWSQGIGQKVDLFVSNPPYICKSHIDMLSPDVLEYDPHLALFADDEGLDVYKKLLSVVRTIVKPGGFVIMEISWNLRYALVQLMMFFDVTDYRFVKDLLGRDRVVVIKVPA